MAHSKFPKKLISITLLASSSLLAGCTPFVHYPHPPYVNKKTAVSAAGGAATGAIVGSMAGAASPGVGIGLLAGAVVGNAFNSPAHWLKKLQEEGVTVIQTGHTVKIVIPSDEIFAFDSDSILPESYPILSNITQFIQNYGRVNITVNGYTDNVGTKLNDLKLSAAQAKSVLAFFWSHGIPSTHLKAIGHGQADPIAANYTVVGSAFNRRIEVTFKYG